MEEVRRIIWQYKG